MEPKAAVLTPVQFITDDYYPSPTTRPSLMPSMQPFTKTRPSFRPTTYPTTYPSSRPLTKPMPAITITSYSSNDTQKESNILLFFFASLSFCLILSWLAHCVFLSCTHSKKKSFVVLVLQQPGHEPVTPDMYEIDEHSKRLLIQYLNEKEDIL